MHAAGVEDLRVDRIVAGPGEAHLLVLLVVMDAIVPAATELCVCVCQKEIYMIYDKTIDIR